MVQQPTHARTAMSANPLMTDGRPPDIRLFGPFRFDLRDERLLKNRTHIELRRKPFSILRYLTAHPQRLITQQELVEGVWGKNVAISQSLLRTHVSEVRRALGEGLIETVVGRGYRFVLAVETEKVEQKPYRLNPPSPRNPAPNLVGRPTELEGLVQIFEASLEAKRHVIFVAGDQGIGKTTLVDAFLAEVAAPRGALVGSGSCIEHLGTAEPYLPVFKALGALCRGECGQFVVELLARHAPTWLAQMPGLIRDNELQTLALRAQGATPARMLRELAEALDVLAAERPLVLVLEDIHWADASTMDLLATLGERRQPARVLVLVTYRPAELTKGGGLARVIAELRARKLATTLSLASWSLAATSDYLAQRFPRARFPEDLANSIQHMTGGNPLFLAAVVDDLERRAIIRPSEAGWELVAPVADVATRLPDAVRQLIDIQLNRLTSNEQRILEAASLVGIQFGVRAVARALEIAADEVDIVCETLANDQHLLQFVASESWPDGSIQSRYAFAHALYRDAALERVPAPTRRLWHRRIAERFEASERAELLILRHIDPAIVALREFHDLHLAGTFTRTIALACGLKDSRSPPDALLGVPRCHFMTAERRSVDLYESEVQDIRSHLAEPLAAPEAPKLLFAARLFPGQLARVRGPLTTACDVTQYDTARFVNAPVVGLWANDQFVLEWPTGAPDPATKLAHSMLGRVAS